MRHLVTALALSLTLAAPSMASACTQLTTDMAFCPEDDWERVQRQLPPGVALWQKPDVTGKIIVEEFRSSSVPESAVIMEAIMAGVRATWEDPDSVNFREHQLMDVGEFERGVLAYDFPLRGKTMRMYHSFLRTDGAVLQFVTNAITSDDAENLEVHRDFVTSFQFTGKVSGV